MDPLSPPNESCQRCGGSFHCGANDAGGCACFGLTLSPELMRRLRADYQRCLCITCLTALQREEKDAARPDVARPA